MYSSVAKWSRARVKTASGGRRHERRVHHVIYPGIHGCIDECTVLVQAIRAFRRGDHEQGADPG